MFCSESSGWVLLRAACAHALQVRFQAIGKAAQSGNIGSAISAVGTNGLLHALHSRHADRCADRQTHRQTDRHTQTDRQTDTHTQTDRQTDRQTDNGQTFQAEVWSPVCALVPGNMSDRWSMLCRTILTSCRPSCAVWVPLKASTAVPPFSQATCTCRPIATELLRCKLYTTHKAI